MWAYCYTNSLIQKNVQQFETHATMEWLVGKVKNGTTGYRDFRNLQLSKQSALCKMTYNMEQLQTEIIPVAGHVDTTYFRQDGARPHTVTIVLDVLQDVYGTRVLSNRFPQRFGYGWSWPPW